MVILKNFVRKKVVAANQIALSMITKTHKIIIIVSLSFADFVYFLRNILINVNIISMKHDIIFKIAVAPTEALGIPELGYILD